MGKKASDVVIGMLSNAGAATLAPADQQPPQASAPMRRTAVATEPAPPRQQTLPAAPTPPKPAAPIPAPAQPAPPPAADAPEAPRTLRLRPDTAGQLRAAWLHAKRDDVLLTAQDFASDLVEEALVARQRRRRPATSA